MNYEPQSSLYYLVVDRTNQLAIPFKTHEFEVAIHEVMSRVYEKLRFLQSCGFQLVQNPELSFESLQINVVREHAGKAHYHVMERFHYNPFTSTVFSSFTTEKTSRFNSLATLEQDIQNVIASLRTCEPDMDIKDAVYEIEDDESIVSEYDSPLEQTFKKVSRKPVPVEAEEVETVESESSTDTEKLLEELTNTINIGPSKLTRDTAEIPDTLSLGTVTDSDEDLDISPLSEKIDVIHELTREPTLEELEEKMEKLRNIKENGMKAIEDLQSQYEKDESCLVDFTSELDSNRREARRLKEKEEERLRIFESDRDVTYVRIKEHLKEGRITEVPPMFQSRFKIFEFMEENELLDSDDSYETYLVLYNELYPEETKDVVQAPYVPHNINYLDDETKAKYSHIKEESKDLIEEFMSRNCTEKKKDVPEFPPVEQMLEDLASSDDEDVSVEDFEEAVEESADALDDDKSDSAVADTKDNTDETLDKLADIIENPKE